MPTPCPLFHNVCACLAVATLSASPAIAATPKSKATAANPEAEAYAERAVERFKAKDFEVSAKLFMQAYARSHSAALVFNAARAYEEAGKAGDAVGLLKLYVTISVDADGIVDARERIHRLDAKVETKPLPVAAPATRSSLSPAAATPNVAVAVKAAPVEQEAAPSKTLAWAATGGAAAAVLSGIALMAVAASNSAAANDLRVADEAGLKVYGARYDHAESQRNAGIGVLAAGVLLGGWAAWLQLQPMAKPRTAVWSLDSTGRDVQLAVRF